MLAAAGRHRLVVVAEDGVAEGGAGSLVARPGWPPPGPAARVVVAGVPVVHVPHGRADDLLAGFGLDGVGLAATASARFVEAGYAPPPSERSGVALRCGLLRGVGVQGRCRHPGCSGDASSETMHSVEEWQRRGATTNGTRGS